MDEGFGDQVYLCPRCLEAQSAPGVCPNDGTKLLTCRPGQVDDPCRRPLMDAEGKIRTRAPLWWLRNTVKNLVRHFEDSPGS
jgi:hypothetical protein